MTQQPAFRCPTCGETLAADSTGLSCVNRHRFDRAREGYVNLLPGGRLKGRPAGDSEGMVRARRVVFDAGLYRPIIDEVANAVAAARPRSILDCGCGEGSYLAAAATTAHAAGWGIDISKFAVRAAARRHRDLRLAVGTSYALPFADATFDVAISVFSPRPFAEMTRVLAAGGTAILVTPGPDHLCELKAMIYDEPRAHSEDGSDEGWAEPDARRTVRFDVALDRPELRTALLEMTPFWWSTPPQRRPEIAERITSVTVDMRLAIHHVDERVRPGIRPGTVGR